MAEESKVASSGAADSKDGTTTTIAAAGAILETASKNVVDAAGSVADAGKKVAETGTSLLFGNLAAKPSDTTSSAAPKADKDDGDDDVGSPEPMKWAGTDNTKGPRRSGDA